MYPIYLDNSLAKAQYKPSNNLETFTRLYDNGKRSKSQIFAMLRGMGYSEVDCENAVNTYMRSEDKKNNEYKMQITFENLTDLLNALKKRLVGIKESDNTRINYTAESSIKIVESILSDMYNFSKNVDKLMTNESTNIKPVLLKVKPEIYYSLMAVNALKTNTQLIPVVETVDVLNQFLNANKNTTSLTSVLYNIYEQENNKYYTECIEDIESLLQRNETFIKENMNVYLNKHSWIPTIKNLLESYSQASNKLVSNSEAIVEKVYSPIQLNEDKSVTVFLNNSFYNIIGSVFEKNTNMNTITPELRAMASILENNGFTFDGDKLKLYKNDSSLEILVEQTNVKINGIKISKLQVEQIKNAIITSKHFRMDEMYKIDNLLILLENFNKIKELDIITRLAGRNGQIIDIVKLSENNIYINRFNSLYETSDLQKVNNYDHAQSIVNEYFNFDISRNMTSMIDAGKALKNDLLDVKSVVESRLDYLDSRIKLLVNENAKLDDINIENAITMLKEEKKTQEIELQTIQEKLSIFVR